jgi:hypothetical protein
MQMVDVSAEPMSNRTERAREGDLRVCKLVVVISWDREATGESKD